MGTEPVNVTLRIIGDAISVFDTSSGTPKTTCSTPLGKPASSSARASASAVAGLSSPGLMMTLQPAASAAESFRAGVIAGKFHGVKAATGPMACFFTSCCTPGDSTGQRDRRYDALLPRTIRSTRQHAALHRGSRRAAFLFKRQQFRNASGALANQVRAASKNTCAFRRHRIAPYVERALCRPQRMVEVSRRCKRHPAQFLQRSGIDDRGSAAFAGSNPFSVDEKIEES